MKHIETQSTKREIKTSEKTLNLKLQCPLFIIGLNSRCWLCFLFVTFCHYLYWSLLAQSWHQSWHYPCTICTPVPGIQSQIPLGSPSCNGSTKTISTRSRGRKGTLSCDITRIGFRIVQIVQCAQPPNTKNTKHIQTSVSSVLFGMRWSRHRSFRRRALSLIQSWYSATMKQTSTAQERPWQESQVQQTLQLPGTSCH